MPYDSVLKMELESQRESYWGSLRRMPWYYRRELLHNVRFWLLLYVTKRDGH